MLDNTNCCQKRGKIQIKIQIMPYILTTQTYTKKNVFILILREISHAKTELTA